MAREKADAGAESGGQGKGFCLSQLCPKKYNRGVVQRADYQARRSQTMRRFSIVLLLCCLAVPCCQRVLPTTDYVNRSVEFYCKGEYDKAIEACNRALSLADPNNPDEREI